MNVYADNAATTKINKKAFDEMIYHMNQTYGNPSSLYTMGQEAKDVLEEARRGIATHLGALPSEVYFTAGGSEADNQAIHIAAELGERKGKKHIITSAIEHHAVLHTLEKLENRGFEITYLPVYENGIVKVEDLREAIREDTALVSIMYVNNEVGTIQPVDEIGAICKEKNVLFHTDAVQAVGHILVNMH